MKSIASSALFTGMIGRTGPNTCKGNKIVQITTYNQRTKAKPNIIGKHLVLSDLFYLHAMSISVDKKMQISYTCMHLIIFMVKV